jgi:hypothetical protein
MLCGCKPCAYVGFVCLYLALIIPGGYVVKLVTMDPTHMYQPVHVISVQKRWNEIHDFSNATNTDTGGDGSIGEIVDFISEHAFELSAHKKLSSTLIEDAQKKWESLSISHGNTRLPDTRDFWIIDEYHIMLGAIFSTAVYFVIFLLLWVAACVCRTVLCGCRRSAKPRHALGDAD